jgi:hypothetical protein
MKRLIVMASLVAGTALAGPTLAQAAPTAQSSDAPGVLVAQAAPTATPAFRPAATPTPNRAGASNAPRAGDFPLDLAALLLAGGALTFGGGALLLRRSRSI